uniref:Uncharacterized protein n=1 Tax=Anopheles stephensi TaxID=30069 RepID=A0A182YSY2_ANOST
MRFDWLLFTMAAVSINGVEVTFERIEQLSGFDILHSTLRVRKYNATTTVLNGSLVSLFAFNNSHKISTIAFHSSLGNQQFNFHPVKLPSAPACISRDMLYDEYGQYFSNVYNLPEKHVCPIVPQEVTVLDKVFPSGAVPAFMPPGLWKAFVILSQHDIELSRFAILCKVTGYFG